MDVSGDRLRRALSDLAPTSSALQTQQFAPKLLHATPSTPFPPARILKPTTAAGGGSIASRRRWGSPAAARQQLLPHRRCDTVAEACTGHAYLAWFSGAANSGIQPHRNSAPTSGAGRPEAADVGTRQTVVPARTARPRAAVDKDEAMTALRRYQSRCSTSNRDRGQHLPQPACARREPTSESSAARSPVRPWWRPPERSDDPGRQVHSLHDLLPCGPETPWSRSSTRSIGPATAAASRHDESSPFNTARPSSTCRPASTFHETGADHQLTMPTDVP